MIKTQIQLPEELYKEAKRVAKEREISFAEVTRRGLEYITSVYPALADEEWHLPVVKVPEGQEITQARINEAINDDRK